MTDDWKINPINTRIHNAFIILIVLIIKYCVCNIIRITYNTQRAFPASCVSVIVGYDLKWIYLWIQGLRTPNISNPSRLNKSVHPIDLFRSGATNGTI